MKHSAGRMTNGSFGIDAAEVVPDLRIVDEVRIIVGADDQIQRFWRVVLGFWRT